MVLGVLSRLLCGSKQYYSFTVRPCRRESSLFIKRDVGERCGSLLASRGDVGVFKLYLSGSVGIQVSCSAENHSVVQDGWSPVSKYSRTFLYIAGHLPHLKAIKQPFYHIYHIFQYGSDGGDDGAITSILRINSSIDLSTKTTQIVAEYNGVNDGSNRNSNSDIRYSSNTPKSTFPLAPLTLMFRTNTSTESSTKLKNLKGLKSFEIH